MTTVPPNVDERAYMSGGTSSEPILKLVARVIRERHAEGGVLVLVDVGCGTGNLGHFIGTSFARYIGVDVVRHQGFPQSGEFYQVNMDTGQAPLADGLADVVASVETIEHEENPRAFVRELKRLARPGGLILVTTPNQLSFLSKLTLVLKNQFNAFTERPGSYPCAYHRLAGDRLVANRPRVRLDRVVDPIHELGTDSRNRETMALWPRRPRLQR